MSDCLLEWNLQREALLSNLIRSVERTLGVSSDRAGELADDVLDRIESLDHIRGIAMSVCRDTDGVPRISMDVRFELTLPET